MYLCFIVTLYMFSYLITSTAFPKILYFLCYRCEKSDPEKLSYLLRITQQLYDRAMIQMCRHLMPKLTETEIQSLCIPGVLHYPFPFSMDQLYTVHIFHHF